MQLSKSLYRSLTAGLVVLAAIGFAPGPLANDFQPHSGQEGKDVVWVPTPQALVDRMLDMARVTRDDYVIDLGSGDGRTVISAAKRGAKAHGIEYNPNMVELSKRNAAKEGMADKVSFVQGDIFESDFSQATVVTLFLLPDLNLRLRPTLLDMKPGTRVVSNTFHMGDWQPDQTVRANSDCGSYCTAHFWIVPAKVEGTWQTPQGELALTQRYQLLSGTLTSGNLATLVNGRLVGDRIDFTAGNTHYTGRINGNIIEGLARTEGREQQWQATRVGKK